MALMMVLEIRALIQIQIQLQTLAEMMDVLNKVVVSRA
jgi:hypothetical protein